MIAVINTLLVKEGAADEIVERFAGSMEHVRDFPGFVSMEILRSPDAGEVLVVTKWRDREAFDSWVGSEAFGKAHSREGSGELLSGRPQMRIYEIAIEL